MPSPRDARQLEARLIELHRQVHNDFAEGRANTLFLVVGFLRWKKKPEEERSYRAPLLLIPVTAVAAGDTLRWIVGDTSSGSGTTRRVHILVKPFSAGLRTNLVITTDRRVYHLQLESTRATAMAALSWTYPQDALIALQRSEAEAEAAMPVATGLAIENLRFGYRIDGDNPPWRPLRAFDDGRQTFIEFPPTIARPHSGPDTRSS
ncbi:MAG: TrbG/VirB9 family P-type conjugative transfer protein [Sphingosinicella sp.]|uniref:TrbG/VirB9 family P-type conjugative transfer protein n=1 Tax=Sphingosinicella sp. TaxID=1917971 RepID=UPI0040381361